MGKSTTTKTRAVFKARFVQGLCRSGPAKSLHIRILKRKASPGASSGALSGKPRETGPPIGPLGSSSSEPANRESPKAKTNPGTTPPARIKAPSAGPGHLAPRRHKPRETGPKAKAFKHPMYPISAKWTKEDCDNWHHEYVNMQDVENFDACLQMSANLLGLDLNDLNEQQLQHTKRQLLGLTHPDAPRRGPKECFTAVSLAFATLQSKLSSLADVPNGAPALITAAPPQPKEEEVESRKRSPSSEPANRASPRVQTSPHDKPPHQISMSPLMSPHVLPHTISPPARSPKPKGVVKKKPHKSRRVVERRGKEIVKEALQRERSRANKRPHTPTNKRGQVEGPPKAKASFVYPMSDAWTNKDCVKWREEYEDEFSRFNLDQCLQMSANLLGLKVKDLTEVELHRIASRLPLLTSGPTQCCYAAAKTAYDTLQSKFKSDVSGPASTGRPKPPGLGSRVPGSQVLPLISFAEWQSKEKQRKEKRVAPAPHQQVTNESDERPNRSRKVRRPNLNEEALRRWRKS